SAEGRVGYGVKSRYPGGGAAMSGQTAGAALALRPLSREEVRSIDARAAGELGMPTIVLMENAGRGAAALLARLAAAGRAPGATPPRVLVLCGPGNNGGDGGVVARHLDLWGFPVKVVWFADPGALRGDAAAQWTVLEKAVFDQVAWRPHPDHTSDPARLHHLLDGADWLVD